ncbi:MAG: magnesium transporter [Planctomycetota bacterium]|nr:MAG: magnesium transporter [Planctomycetota bacterium]
MINTLYLPELREMLAEQDENGLREFCSALHPARTAEFMEGLTPDEAWEVLRYADDTTRVEIFLYFDRERQLEILRRGEPDEMGRFIGELPPDDRVDILQDLEPELVETLMKHVPVQERRDIMRLSAYPEDTAGAIMTTEFARINRNVTPRTALEEIGRQAEELETIYYIYVVDEENHLDGVVSARQLLAALGKPNVLVRDLMETELITAHVNDDQADVARKVADYDLLAIPVVDDERHLVGIVTHDDVIDVFVDEATEDAHMMGAVTPLERSYLDARFFNIWRKRVGWLALLLVGESLTIVAMTRFESAMAAVLALSFFVPLCISTGGNSGSQAAALVIRALALGEITVGDWWRVVRREVMMGLAMGAALGIIGFLYGAMTPAVSLGDVSRWMLATVVGLAIAVICLWGTLVGTMLPIGFQRLGIDPGFASNPAVATLVDVTGIVIYFSVATLLIL